ncbi:MAG: hydrogenase nickel incorporation protein HypB [Armatimonadota bacterium]|nr:hydrogenase nickel incorporation protein HypB [Armatimonadota bacterium]MCX7776807.1 hydrogenase nickel incorporation protein HypB [Armatimonadota bacterium]MDW8024603.1 hydrogenase nickel incorporation protein HypB [Armatimonadota bacterium]
MANAEGQWKQVLMLERLLQANELIAERLRERLTDAGVLLINMLSSPGSGKTTLLEATVKALSDKLRVGAILGDVATERDYERLSAYGVPAVQIVTGGECHLEAAMVEQAMHRLPIENLSVVFIENVGNLVCPAEFRLGEHFRVTLLSVPEGEDKVLKYPHAFRTADAVLITKVDLLEHVRFNVELAEGYIHSLNPNARVVKLSALTGYGLDEWLSLLLEWHKDVLQRVEL